MAIPVTVPRLGWNMEEGVFVGWLKCDGDTVRPGEPLFTLEGEKATEDVECLDGGILMIAPEGPRPGDRIPVGALLGYLVGPGEPAPFGREPEVPSAREAAPPQVVREPPASPAVRRLARERGIDLGRVQGTGPGGRISREDLPQAREAPALAAAPPTSRPPLARRRPAISPRARRAAEELVVDWSGLQGSGRSGRIRERDVRAAAGKTGAPRPDAVVPAPVSSIRRTIAGRMADSSRTMAAVTLTTTADADNLVNLRTQFKAAGEKDGTVPTVTDILVKLVAGLLPEHPLLNACWEGETIVHHPRVHVGLAVDTEAGLVVPVLRDPAGLGLRELAGRRADLVARARTRKLAAEDMQGGTFTVTNLGAFDIDAFTPIIHPGQSAVLGVGRIARRPAVREDTVVIRNEITLSLTFDHRVVDGAPAARFLQALARRIAHPAPWLLA